GFDQQRVDFRNLQQRATGEGGDGGRDGRGDGVAVNAIQHVERVTGGGPRAVELHAVHIVIHQRHGDVRARGGHTDLALVVERNRGHRAGGEIQRQKRGGGAAGFLRRHDD